MDMLDSKTAPADPVVLRAEQEAAEKLWRSIGELPPADRYQAAQDWAAEHGHLFFWCCGMPVFGGPEEEKNFETSSHYTRGDLGGNRVFWL